MLIYLILMALITAYYIIDYINRENYDIQYKKISNFYTDKEIDKINKNDRDKNPYITLSIIIAESPFSENIKLYEFYDERFFEKDITKNVSSFYILALYKCEDENCTIPIEDTTQLSFRFSAIYKNYFINHQSKNSLFEKRYTVYSNYFYFDNRTEVIPDWRYIIYKEKKGFFKKEEIFYNGYLDNYNKLYLKNLIMFINGTYYKILQEFHINNDHLIQEEYERTAKDIFDYIAIILSYFSNGFFIAKFIFNFYSKNFNNYKIIEKILTKNNNIINYKKPSDFVNFSVNSESQSESNDNNIEEDFLENEKVKDKDKESELILSYKKEKDNERKINFKKIRFVHFFLNNFYCKCCSKFNNQETLNIYNKILYKYISLDSIAYNQILLENLFHDYKWNNPSLKNIDNNDLIFQLRNHMARIKLFV